MNFATQAMIIDFDDLAPGTVVNSLDGVTFSSNIGLDLIVSSGFDTTSGSNYLGANDSGFEVFFPGDIVTLAFNSLQQVFSASSISTPLTPDGSFDIVALLDSVVVGSTSTTAPASQVLPDGGEVFSVGIGPGSPGGTTGAFQTSIDRRIASGAGS